VLLFKVERTTELRDLGSYQKVSLQEVSQAPQHTIKIE